MISKLFYNFKRLAFVYCIISMRDVVHMFVYVCCCSTVCMCDSRGFWGQLYMSGYRLDWSLNIYMT